MRTLRASNFPGLTVQPASMAPYIVVNSNATLFQQQPSLGDCVRLALERAIQEIIAPVVERSVKICVVTVMKLVAKDFYYDGEDARLRLAARSMVQHLAGSFAMVTCKEPLRASLTNSLRSILINALAPDQKPNQLQMSLIEQAATLACQDNIDLACAFVEKTATDKAVQDIEEHVTEELEQRRRSRATSALTLTPPVAALPFVLRPKHGGVDAGQFLLYETFALVPPSPPGDASASSKEEGGMGQGGGAGYGAPSGYPATSVPSSSASLAAAFAAPSAATASGATAAAGPLPAASASAPVPSSAPAGPAASAPQASRPPSLEAFAQLDQLLSELQRSCLRQPVKDFASLPPNSDVHTVLRALQASLAQSQARGAGELLSLFVQRLVQALFELDPAMLLSDCLQVALRELLVYPSVSKDATKFFAGYDSERKLNAEVVTRLLRFRILDVHETDACMARWMDGGRFARAVAFAEDVLRLCLLSELRAPHLSLNDFPQTLDLILRLAQTVKPAPQTQALLESLALLRKNSVPAAPGGAQAGPSAAAVASGASVNAGAGAGAGAGTGALAVGAAAGAAPASAAAAAGLSPKDPSSLFRHLSVQEEAGDPPGLRDNIGFLFEEWFRMASQGRQDPKFVQQFIQRLVQQSMLKTDDISTRFFRICTDYCIQFSLAGASDAGQPAYVSIDAYSRLVSALLKHFGDQSKVALLSKVLMAVMNLCREHSSQAAFNPRPYHRLLLQVLAEIPTTDEPIALQSMATFANALHLMRPSAIPAFAFCWLDIVAHRSFMPRLLVMRVPKSWGLLLRLLVDLFTFMAPSLLLRSRLTDGVRLLYRGTLRIMLVLLHDFPEFLVEYHFSLCDVIPPTCVQIRNLVLSAFPRNMRLPDPFTPNLKVDLLPEIAQQPVIPPAYSNLLEQAGLLNELDAYLRTRAPVTLLLSLRSRLLLPAGSREELSGSKYNVPLLNALVLHVGVRGIDLLKTANHESSLTHGGPMDVFQHLTVDLDCEGRYALFNALANQLRFPNSHTHYFSRVLLHLFLEASKELIQEQITRVLLERLIANRPHPWGLLITFIELIKNRSYNFWERSFVRCAPEIERLFESVSRSCSAHQRGDEGGQQPVPQ